MTQYELAVSGSATVQGPANITLGTIVTSEHLCPDLLRIEQLGPADGWRGRVVRGFLRLMNLWPVRA